MTLPNFSVTQNNFLSLIKQYNIPVVNIYNTLDLDHINNLEGQEGVVVRFTDGHCVKIKGSWYVDLHKTKEAIQTERYVIKMIFSEMVDDVLPKLQEDDAKKLVAYQKEVAKEFREYCGKALDIADEVLDKYDRKTFAIEHAPKYSSDLRSFLFKCYDPNFDCDAMKYFGELIIKKTGCNKNLKEVEHIYGYRKWDYNGIE